MVVGRHREARGQWYSSAPESWAPSWGPGQGRVVPQNRYRRVHHSHRVLSSSLAEASRWRFGV